ncbi:MAG TPA: VTT domain-containing protein [Caulobacteraceae bacterium]|jgi:membrane protein DedA with SNARE-associated domain|nr:VTT domain-containing protein [Caulobacteraceae bacterium]
MPHVLLIRVIPLIARYGYWVLLPVAVVEGPATAAITGALVAAGQFDGVTACLLLVAADLIGDGLYYLLGRYGHGPLFNWIDRWLRITPERLKRVEAGFHANDWKLIMLGKTQALGGLILYFAGASRMNFVRYMGFNLIGTFPKVILFEMVGFFLGASILQTTSRRLDYITFALFAMAMLLLGSYWLLRRRLSKDLAPDISP